MIIQFLIFPRSYFPLDTNLHYQYSTEEVDTGHKWIDGKSIYRKCFQYKGKIPASSRKIIGSITSHDNIITTNLMLKASGSNKWYHPLLMTSDGNYDIGSVEIVIDPNSDVVLVSGSEWTNTVANVIVEYTK